MSVSSTSPCAHNPYSRCGSPARGHAPMLPLRQTSARLRPRRWERRWRHQDFGCWRVEPGSRFTRDFEAECVWLMTVASQKTVSGFLHVAWRTAGQIARRVAGRLKAAMGSPFDGLHAIGVDETSYRKGHTYITVVVDHERRRVVWAHYGYGRDVFDVLPAARPGAAHIHPGCHRRRGEMDRLVRARMVPRRGARGRRGPQTPVEPDQTRRRPSACAASSTWS